jgi:hypothetical protein
MLVGHPNRLCRGLKMPDLGRYNRPLWEWVDDVPAIGIDFQRDRHGSAVEWLHQMRPDLGRLAAEILQIGPFVMCRPCLAAQAMVVYRRKETTGSIP